MSLLVVVHIATTSTLSLSPSIIRLLETVKIEGNNERIYVILSLF